MQRNWVGKSYGTEILSGSNSPALSKKKSKSLLPVPIPCTASLYVLAPEHPLVAKITTPDKKAEVEAYVARPAALTDIERLSTEKEKDGRFHRRLCH